MDPATRGQRIARARRRRGLPQAALAGLIGRSESWLSQVERGVRGVDSHRVLARLAEILRIDLSELTGQDTTAEAAATYSAAQEIRAAMMRYDALENVIGDVPDQRPAQWHSLQVAVKHINGLYQATRYEEAGERLPHLIREIEIAARSCPEADRPAVYSIRAQVYHVTAAVLNRVGEPGLAWTACDRSVSAAEHADSQIMGAVSAYRLAHVFIKHRETVAARDIAMGAVHALDRPGHRLDPGTLSLLGGLYLAAASAAAADFDRAGVDHFLSQAHGFAERVNTDRNDHWTAFGPTNVQIHEVSTAVAFGDADLAVERGERLNLAALPPGLLGRRSQVSLDLARGYAQQRHDAAAVNLLLQAEEIAPQLVRYDNSTHDLLGVLLKREHRASTPQLRPLAHRAGLI